MIGREVLVVRHSKYKTGGKKAPASFLIPPLPVEELIAAAQAGVPPHVLAKNLLAQSVGDLPREEALRQLYDQDETDLTKHKQNTLRLCGEPMPAEMLPADVATAKACLDHRLLAMMSSDDDSRLVILQGWPGGSNEEVVQGQAVRLMRLKKAGLIALADELLAGNTGSAARSWLKAPDSRYKEDVRRALLYDGLLWAAWDTQCNIAAIYLSKKPLGAVTGTRTTNPSHNPSPVTFFSEMRALTAAANPHFAGFVDRLENGQDVPFDDSDLRNVRVYDLLKSQLTAVEKEGRVKGIDPKIFLPYIEHVIAEMVTPWDSRLSGEEHAGIRSSASYAPLQLNGLTDLQAAAVCLLKLRQAEMEMPRIVDETLSGTTPRLGRFTKQVHYKGSGRERCIQLLAVYRPSIRDRKWQRADGNEGGTKALDFAAKWLEERENENAQSGASENPDRRNWYDLCVDQRLAR